MRMFQLLILLCLSLSCCNGQTNGVNKPTIETATNEVRIENKEILFDTTSKTIHIYVALCDNKYQGIVPVPEKIGNGQNPNSNLYWGCGYGIRTYFKKSAEWKLLRTQKLDSIRLERLVFKHISKNYYLIADAYDGQFIQQCTEDFLQSSTGLSKDTIHVNDKTVGVAGNSSLLAYIGHDGLMDFELSSSFQNTDDKKRDVIILACYSKHFFSPHLVNANVNPLVWTTGLMCTEAYTVHDAITGYINNESNDSIRTRAAKAYSTYQKCGEKAARNLLVTGW